MNKKNKTGKRKVVELKRKEVNAVSGGYGHPPILKPGEVWITSNGRKLIAVPGGGFQTEDGKIIFFRTRLSVVRQLVNHYAITYKQLSNIIGIAYSHLIKLVNEKTANLPFNTIKKMSSLFNVSIRELQGNKKINFKKLPQKLKLKLC